jgi:hypothetical protein
MISEWLCVCGSEPCNGLDCGVYLPGRKPRKVPHKKTASEMAQIRQRAWETRRAKYGECGHR